MSDRALLEMGLQFVKYLVDARRSGDITAPGVAAIQLAGHIEILTVVLANMAERIIGAEHGPLVDPSQLDIKPRPWQTAAEDQIEGLVRDGEWESAANMGLDTLVRSCREDVADPEVGADLGHVMRGLALMDQRSLCVVAAAAIYRLAQQ